MGAENVIFITGTGRSGTNILKNILSRHSNVGSLPFEYRFSVDPHGVLDFYNTFPAYWSPYYADSKLKELESFLLSLAAQSDDKAAAVAAAKATDPVGLQITPPPYAGWELNEWIPGYSRFVKELIEALAAFRYPAVWPGAKEGVEKHHMLFSPLRTKADLTPHLQTFLKNCFDAICKKQGKTFFADDNTHHLLFAADLMQLVPNAKIIHVVRDPRDVISSLMKQRWAPSDVNECLQWLSGILKRWHAQKALLKPSAYVEIRMEDLISSPREVLSRLSEFSGFELEDDMLEVDLQHHNIGRYKTDLSRQERDAVELHLEAHMREFTYPCTHQSD